MDKRIYGLETEYGTVGNGDPRFNDDFMEKKVDRRTFYGFLENGARFYIDRLDLDNYSPEYATPECASVLDAIIWDKAGEKIVYRTLGGFCDLFKINSSWSCASRGCHENYLVASSLFRTESKIMYLFTPFLISRQIICGSGSIDVFGGPGPIYTISQRSRVIESILSQGTTCDRAIINFKGGSYYDSLSKDLRYGRLHLILGDANMSEVSCLLKLGTTGIVLRMIEDGFLKESPYFRDVIRVLHLIDKDISCKKVFMIANGKYFSAVNMQEYYLDAALSYFSKYAEPTSEEALILKIWREVLDKLKINPMTLDKKIDWVIKKRLIDNYMNKHGLSLNNKDVRKIDFLYHNLNPEIGLYYYLLEKGKMDCLLKPSEICFAETNPPSDTRAYIRGKLISALFEAKASWRENISLYWFAIYLSALNNKIRKTTVYLHPFESRNKTIEKLIETIKGE